jgi:hypothetical protein
MTCDVIGFIAVVSKVLLNIRDDVTQFCASDCVGRVCLFLFVCLFVPRIYKVLGVDAVLLRRLNLRPGPQNFKNWCTVRVTTPVRNSPVSTRGLVRNV